MSMATWTCSSSSSPIFFTPLSSPHSTTPTNNHNHGFFLSIPTPSSILPPCPITLSILGASSRRKNTTHHAIPSKKKKKKKESQKLPENDDGQKEGFDEDAIEALFNQLEEDLRNELPSDEGDDEVTEEDLARLEQELQEAFGSSDEFDSSVDNGDSDIDEDDEDGDEAAEEEEEEEEEDQEEEEERPLKLKNWQLRRLASALKIGRRKTSIKNLAAELCLDRAVVLELLRDPPPNLLLMSAALPDEIVRTSSEPEIKATEPSTEVTEDVLEPQPEVKLPIHAMQSRWLRQKRLKKVQIETLERVYIRSKRPTNAMVSSIVHVTNLPRKRVVQWFEEKRAEEGIPHHRVPYQRSTAETMITK